jgi:hypothetical protein
MGREYKNRTSINAMGERGLDLSENGGMWHIRWNTDLKVL